MRTFLLTVFWITNFGNVIQLLIMVSATWIILAGSIPILIISPVKLVLGTIIGLWAYSTAKGMPRGPEYT